MRATVPVACFLLAGCAASTPLDLIPREDLLMIQAVERMEAQSPMALRTPAPQPDLNAQYRAALLAAGIEPTAPDGSEPAGADAPAPPPPRPAAPEAAASQSAVAASADAATTPRATSPAAPPPAAPAAQAPAGPITVEEMLGRVRQRAAAAP